MNAPSAAPISWYIFILYNLPSEGPEATVAMDCGEGPWDGADGAAEFGSNEVGFPWVLVPATPTMAATLEAARERSTRAMLDACLEEDSGFTWRVFNIRPGVVSDPDTEAGLAEDSGAGPFHTAAEAAHHARTECAQWTLVPTARER